MGNNISSTLISRLLGKISSGEKGKGHWKFGDEKSRLKNGVGEEYQIAATINTPDILYESIYT